MNWDDHIQCNTELWLGNNEAFDIIVQQTF